MRVPCGQCMGCRLERSRQWAIRCVHEAQMHDENCFITLTYDDENLPPFGDLVKSDYQKFMKRLRKRLEGRQARVRFFHCGEYGETTARPHYHAILFGYRPPDPELFSYGEEFPLYTSKELSSVWGMGHATFGEATFDTAAYVARYCTKKVTGDAAQAHYEVIDEETGEVYDRQPEYSTQSRRPGIGHGWMERFGRDAYAKDEVILNGRAMRPPRAYDKLFEHSDPKTWESVRGARQRRFRSRVARKDPDHPSMRERRLYDGEFIARKRAQQRDWE